MGWTDESSPGPCLTKPFKHLLDLGSRSTGEEPGFASMIAAKVLLPSEMSEQTLLQGPLLEQQCAELSKEQASKRRQTRGRNSWRLLPTLSRSDFPGAGGSVNTGGGRPCQPGDAVQAHHEDPGPPGRVHDEVEGSPIKHVTSLPARSRAGLSFSCISFPFAARAFRCGSHFLEA